MKGCPEVGETSESESHSGSPPPLPRSVTTGVTDAAAYYDFQKGAGAADYGTATTVSAVYIGVSLTPPKRSAPLAHQRAGNASCVMGFTLRPIRAARERSPSTPEARHRLCRAPFATDSRLKGP